MNINLLYIALAVNAVGIAAAVLHLKGTGSRFTFLAKAMPVASFALLTAMIALAWADFGRPPFKTLFESLVLLAWCTAAVTLFTLFNRQSGLLWLTASIVSCGVLSYALARNDMEEVMLPPALRSGWFVPHVVVYFIGYSALVLGSVIALFNSRMLNFYGRINKKGKEDNTPIPFERVLKVGFIFLTSGLVMGALWADAAWGAYWGWDPKENWALATFLVYGAWLHLPEQDRNRLPGKIVLAAGLGIILFTYLGMDLLPVADGSLHVYQ